MGIRGTEMRFGMEVGRWEGRRELGGRLPCELFCLAPRLSAPQPPTKSLLTQLLVPVQKSEDRGVARMRVEVKA